MKAISKTQIIDLMININRDGVDNTQYSIDIFVSPVKPEKWYDGIDTGCEDLQPGAYCALWVDDTDCSNMPSVGKWIDKKLTEENIVLFDNGKGWIILICLELL